MADALMNIFPQSTGASPLRIIPSTLPPMLIVVSIFVKYASQNLMDSLVGFSVNHS